MAGRLSATIVMAVLVVGMTQAALAFEPMEGCLLATQPCAASVSIREGRAGNPQLKVGQSYRLVGANKAGDPSHYQVKIEGASPAARWVGLACGRLDPGCNGGPASATNVPAPGAAPASMPAPAPAPKVGNVRVSDDNLLALSWHPAFCELRPNRGECRGNEATALVLHGLWPQPRDNHYCDVSHSIEEADRNGRWSDLPAPKLTEATRRDLETVMPGTASNLDRHEYWKHGTCYGGDAERYFADSIALVDQLNESAVGALFAGHIGDTLTLSQVRASFDDAFGKGAGRRVSLQCDDVNGRTLLMGIDINLAGEPGPGVTLADLIATAPSRRSYCQAGEIDPSGRGR